MKKKIIYAIACFIILLFMIVRFRSKLSVVIEKHAQIDIDMLIRNTESQEEYYLLGQDTVVMGKIEAIAQIPSGDQEYEYIEYKINGFNHAPAYLPSYGVTIDTTELPDGWNELLVIGYKDKGKLEGVKQIRFKVDNNNEKKLRALRQGKTYEVGSVPSYKREYIPVLMYHDFQENITPEQESAIVHPELFEEQLKVLLENQYTPITFKDLYLYMNGEGGLPAKPIIITADDGYLSNYETAFPILKKYNIPATFFITTRYIGIDTSSPHFTWEQAQEMEESGLIDIQSHSHSHLLMSQLPENEMLYQAAVSFGLIEQNLGERDVKVLAYPQFYNNRHTREKLLEAGVDLQATRLGKRYSARTEPTNIQRIHVANYTSPEILIKEIKKLTK